MTITPTGSWEARITSVHGPLIPITAKSTEAEGPDVCAARARAVIDRYIAFLDADPSGDD